MIIKRKVFNLYTKIINRYSCYQRRKKLDNIDFTIISNNCWAGFIYQKYGLQYKTPTIGLFFIGNDYIKFCKNLKYYVDQELQFIDFKKSKNYDFIKNSNTEYPVARLDDIEIYFMHYKNENEAKEKWERRCKRINYENIIFKISQREGYEKSDIEEFLTIDSPHLLAFSYDKIENSIYVPKLKDLVGDETKLLNSYFNELEVLNKKIK